MESFSYKGISEGKYVEGETEALNLDEASHILKEQKIIITNLIRSNKKKGEAKAKAKGKGGGFSLFGKKSKSRRNPNIFKTIRHNGQSRSANTPSAFHVKRSA